MNEIFFLTWDWKEQPDMEKLDAILEKIAGAAKISEIDTESDLYAIAIYSRTNPITPKALKKAFWKFLRED